MKRKHYLIPRWTLLGMLAGIMALAVASGCISTGPGSSSLASVVVENASLSDVQEATLQVFAAERYSVQSSSQGRVVFVREGSRRDRVQYGILSENLQMRVEVALETYPPSGVLLRADAYAVHDGSMQGATKLLRIARGPYQDLLEKVQKRSEKPAAPVSKP